jgi:hypothetical protein
MKQQQELHCCWMRMCCTILVGIGISLVGVSSFEWCILILFLSIKQHRTTTRTALHCFVKICCTILVDLLLQVTYCIKRQEDKKKLLLGRSLVVDPLLVLHTDYIPVNKTIWNNNRNCYTTYWLYSYQQNNIIKQQQVSTLITNTVWDFCCSAFISCKILQVKYCIER